jgi:hypothetical protein
MFKIKSFLVYFKKLYYNIFNIIKELQLKFIININKNI